MSKKKYNRYKVYLYQPIYTGFFRLLSLKNRPKKVSVDLCHICLRVLSLAECLMNHMTDSAELLPKGHVTKRNDFD